MIVISKQQIVEQIHQDWLQKPQSQICIAIFNYLVGSNSQHLSHITYGSLRKVLGKAYDNQDLLAAIQYLCGDRTHLLETKFELIENDNYFEISDDDMIEARETGQLLHPETGELINDFEDKVFIYFQPSSVVKNLA
ncbi:hypothetical protein NIES267_64440 [Calothrix parasitica NIES-267]|uniref:Uncharacterized protein n=1 Tax=Calothrix parasitica NIES-267 TaxID=1973488 RepID=A0A1Z4M0B9_9CYAN|nr:hypothetical protein NIES267_64440 [Calothrix parasitica NIES-267]